MASNSHQWWLHFKLCKKGCSVLVCRHWWRCWSWSPSWWLHHLLHGRWAKPYKFCMSVSIPVGTCV